MLCLKLQEKLQAVNISEPILPMAERVKKRIADDKQVKIFTARVTHGHEAAVYIHE